MSKYAQHVSTKKTPQSEKIFGSNQVANSAGGFSFAVDNWTRLNRFLVLGSEGGSYYAGEHEITVANAKGVIECIKENGVKVVDTVIEISHSGRAPKNDPAIFVLALVAKFGDNAARSHVYRNLSKVCRISTHLFQFLSVADTIGKGTGLGLCKAVSRWYNEKDIKDLALQVIKYRNREGFEHRDALRLAHVKTADNAHNEIYKWIAWSKYKAGKDVPVSSKNAEDAANYLAKHNQIIEWVKSHYNDNGELKVEIHPLINAFEAAQRAKTVAEILPLIKQYQLPREVIPTDLLKEAAVWEMMLPHMPMTAMIRNLATMTRIGLIKPLSNASKIVIEKLGSVEAIKKARVHPIQLLSALRTYNQGHGFRSDNTWTADQNVVDALDGAFYTAFDAVEPTGKRIMLSLDVSGSMGSGDIAGVPSLTPRDASGALAMVTAKVEKQVYINGFTSGSRPSMHAGYSTGLTDLKISGKKRLDDVIQTISNLDFGGTDCALPMLHAIENKLEVDAFVIYTDSETWHGNIHPNQALQQYRKASGIPAKLIVVGMVANEFTIADPNDSGMMDVVGFDTSTPALMSNFIKE